MLSVVKFHQFCFLLPHLSKLFVQIPAAMDVLHSSHWTCIVLCAALPHQNPNVLPQLFLNVLLFLKGTTWRYVFPVLSFQLLPLIIGFDLGFFYVGGDCMHLCRWRSANTFSQLFRSCFRAKVWAESVHLWFKFLDCVSYLMTRLNGLLGYLSFLLLWSSRCCKLYTFGRGPRWPSPVWFQVLSL